MSIKCSVYIATSVDGFIATLDGGLDWLEKPEYSAVPMKGLSYVDFIQTVDGLVMGRNTFEKVLTFDRWPYDGIPVVVLSRTMGAVPSHLVGAVRIASGTPHEIVGKLQEEGMHHLYIDGGITIQQFLQASLIDEITITRIPVLLGSGVPLFGISGKEQQLKLMEAVASASGIIQERYKIEGVA